MASGTEIASLYASIDADTSGFSRGLDEVSNKFDAFGEMMTGGLRRMGEMVVNAGVQMAQSAVSMGEAVATTGINFDDLKEKSTIAFTTMLGSADKAQKMLDDLQAFAAKTPFEFPDLLTASQRLLAMGFSSDKILPTMTAVGDAVAGLGGGKDTIDHIVMAMGQMNTEGKTDARTMRELTIAGIPAWQMLADKIGVSVPEAMKMVTKGAIDAKTTIDAVTAGMEQKFGGMMDKQSHTWSGLMSNLQDFFTQASGKVMKPFFDFAEKGLSQLVDFMSSDTFSKGIDDFAANFGNAIAYVQDALSRFVTVFGSDISIITSANSSWGERLLAVWDMIYQVGLSIWNSLATELDTLIPQWLDSIGKWASSLWQWIVNNIPIALKHLGEWAASLWSWLVKNLPTWISNLAKWAVELWQWIVAVTPRAIQAMAAWGYQIFLAINAWAATMGPLVSALWNGIVSLFIAGGELLQGHWANIWPNLVNAATDFGLAAKALWDEYGKQLWQWIVDATPKVLATLGTWLAAVGTWISSNAPSWGATLAGWGKALWQWIVDVTPVVLQKLGEWAGALNKWIVTNVPLIATLESWGIALWKWIADAFGPFVSWLGQLAAQFISWKDVLAGSILALGVIFWPTISAAFTAIMGAIGGFVVAWAPVLALFAGAIVAVSLLRNGWERDWGGIRTNTMAALTFLAQAFAPLGAAIQQFGSQSLAEIIAWATGNQTNFAATQKIWEAAKTSFGTVFDAISAKLSEWAKIAWDWFQTNFPNAAQTANAAVDSIMGHWSLFVEATHPLIVKIQDAWNKLVADWKTGGGGVSDAMSRLKNLLDNIWAIMLSSMSYAINTVLNLMTLVVQLIDGDWAGAWKTAQNMVHDAWEYIKNVSYYALDAIAGLFGSNADTVLASIAKIYDNMRDAIHNFDQAGRDIIQGLWNGISSAWNDYIAGPVMRLWNSLPEGMKAALGIRSPSTIFADIGDNMMKGLAAGITGGQQFVTDAMGNLIESTKKAGQWDKLGDAIGMSQATAFANSLKAAGLNALSDIKRAGIGDNSNAFDFATQLTQSSGTDTIGNLQNNLNNLITQFDALGLTNSGGAGTRDSLSSLSGTLGDLLSTGNYYAPYSPGGGTGGGGSGGDNTNILNAIAVTLGKILIEVIKDGKMAHEDVNFLANVFKTTSGDLKSKVNGKVALMG